MGRWNTCLPPGQFAYDVPLLKKNWPRLHASDQEAWPQSPQVLQAWAHLHNGQLELAYRQGCALGPAGATVANRAACLYATQLDPQAPEHQSLCLAVAERAEQQLQQDGGNANAYFLLACALGRYSQSLSVAKGLAQGLGSRIKGALESAMALQPRHADACFALGSFHADIIDKVGLLIGNMTLGARREVSLEMFERGFALQPDSPSGLLDYATALLMLDGEARRDEATTLCARAARLRALDARSFLEIAAARRGLPG